MSCFSSLRALHPLRVCGCGLVVAATLGLGWEGLAAASGSALSAAPPPKALARQLPAAGGSLRFDRNEGQLEDEVRFLARAPGYGLFLTRDEARLSLARPGQPPALVSLRLVGARSVEPRGVDELPGRSNYFAGPDRSRWRRGVTSFASVRYPDVLPGVDLVYRASPARQLEYDLLLAPGVEPSSLELQLDGVASLELRPDGGALLRLSDGSSLRKEPPIAYQFDDAGTRTFVAAKLVKLAAGRLGFWAGPHDPTRPLIIDPVLNYSTYLGGSRFDEFLAVAADAAGNTYAVGYTTGTLFPTRAPAQASYGGGASDAVICKLNAAGTSLVYATYLGGNDADRANGVAVDAGGNAYITGLTFSSNFPTLAALQSTHGGGLQDAFVAKLNASGGLVYSTFLGGAADDAGQGIAVRSGEAYVVGTTFSNDFPLLGPSQPQLGGGSDAFVSKLSITGNSFVYSTYLGGSGSEYGQGIALDNAGNAFVVGQTGSGNFPTVSAAQPVFGGAASDAFVSKLGNAGSSLVYSTYLGGSAPDVATSVAQVGGAAVVVGYTSSINFPTASASQAALAGGSDAFVTRMSGNGAGFDFSTYLGGAGNDQALGAATDPNGFVYVVGQTASGNFPLLSPISGQTSLNGSSDAFLTGVSPAGQRLYSSFLGGSAADSGVAVAVGNPLTLHVLGNTFSNDFPTQAALFGSALGPQDGFVARLSTLTLSPAPWGSPRLLGLTGLLLLGSGVLLLSKRKSPASA